MSYISPLIYQSDDLAVARKTYPMQIASIIHKSTREAGETITVLGVDAHLSLPPLTDGAGRLQPKYSYLDDSPFSRFVFTLIEKKNGITRSVFCNVPIDALAPAAGKTHRILLAETMSAINNASGESLNRSAVRTVRFEMGPLKGKSPGEVLKEGASGRAALEKQREYLVRNSVAYPRNHVLIDAIDAAFEHARTGSDETAPADESGSVSPQLTILGGQEYKPLTSRPTNKNGLTFVYNVLLTFDPVFRAPFVLSITNGYAPVENVGGGQINVRSSAVEEKSQIRMNLMRDEWETLVFKLSDTVSAFNISTFRERYEAACRDRFRQAEQNR